MTILAIIFMGLMVVMVSASEGDYGPAKKLGEIVVYIILFGIFFAFLAATGVPGLFISIVVFTLIALCSTQS